MHVSHLVAGLSCCSAAADKNLTVRIGPVYQTKGLGFRRLQGYRLQVGVDGVTPQMLVDCKSSCLLILRLVTRLQEIITDLEKECANINDVYSAGAVEGYHLEPLASVYDVQGVYINPCFHGCMLCSWLGKKTSSVASTSLPRRCDFPSL